MKNIKLLTLSLALAAVALTGVQAHAAAPLITISGTVLSRDADHIVVQTEKGNLSFDVDTETQMPAGALEVGSRITIWYDSDDKTTDKMDARKIEFMPAETQAATPPASTPAEEPSTETAVETRTEEQQLPSTASPLPLVGSLGTLSLMAGALLLRRRR
jgi:hypothetical protein